ncbi:tigger transposable element-derived protein 1 [Caerostris darwini]|uniref:Tigger transposable element-derived protein 1 n=1 Tax=Caerostris darwini TaxID=1538125 RepID=A0AAV4UU42_9ARAC|nr:tigger transposable element-derived protein 1 [Caerostris darwini]
MWRSNPKAWVTRKFVEWVNLVFGPTVKKYLQENNLPVQALLILDNAPAHPPNLEDDILEELKFIKVLYLPPNTTPILQPMDQQVISNFKKLYTKHLFRRCFEVTESTNLTLREFWKDHFNIAICLQIIDQAWLGVTTKTLTSAWKKLWPEAVAERIYEELEPGVSVEEEIVSLGKSMGLEVEERDVNELIEEYTQELTTEEIQELQSQQHTEVMQEIGFEESEEEGIIRTLWLGDDIKKATDALRIHHQLFPNYIQFEEQFPAIYLEKLRSFGHTTEPETEASVFMGILKEDGKVKTNVDYRKGGSAEGF